MPYRSRFDHKAIFPIACLALAFGVYILANQRVSASAFGPSPSFTDAPGEGNCTACHTTYVVNSGSGNVVITGLPTNYLPNQSVPVTVTVNDLSAVIFGFELTAIDEQGRPAGSLIPVITNPQQTQVVYGLVGGNVREYMEHTIDGILPTQFFTKSWTMNWQAPATRVGRITFYAAGNGADSSGSPNGDYIYTTSSSTYSGSAPADFDGDGKSDISVYRPSNGAWYITRSSNNVFSGQSFGVGTDKLVPGDFDGDGKHDLAVFRPSNGNWYVLRSSNGAFSADAFGMNGDVPVIGDFDGDGKSDLTVFRPSNGTWYVLRSSNGSLQVTPFGSSGDQPVPGDYDADGKTDVAVYRPVVGAWYLLRSSDGAFSGQFFGATSDKPVPGDYDGDGKTDVAVYRPAIGTWYILQSTAGFTAQAFGVSSDKPAPGDFDGDGKTDVSVFRDGAWYILLSTTGGLRAEQFGAIGDVPVTAAYIPE